jgi:hypothetical protein
MSNELQMMYSSCLSTPPIIVEDSGASVSAFGGCKYLEQQQT